MHGRGIVVRPIQSGPSDSGASPVSGTGARYAADPAYRAAKAEAARCRRVRLKEAPFRAALERLKAGTSVRKVRARIVHPGGQVRVSDPKWLCEAGAYSDADKTAEARYDDPGSLPAGTLWERVAHSR